VRARQLSSRMRGRKMGISIWSVWLIDVGCVVVQCSALGYETYPPV
jgi:hypothetical protein